MQFNKFLLTLSVALSSAAFQLNASPCSDFINQVKAGLDTSVGQTGPRQKAAWENLQAFKDNLGEPIEKKTVEYKLYLWKNYGGITKDGVLDESMGSADVKKSAFEKLTAETLTQRLGAPDSVQSQTLTTNTWKCDNDTIIATTDDEGNLIDINIGGYGKPLNQSTLQKQLNSQSFK